MTTPEPPDTLNFPSDAEVQAWAEQERQRRAAWLEGPTQDQKVAWARRERERRLADDLGAAQPHHTLIEPVRMTQRLVREAQLISEGAFSLMWKWSQRGLDVLVREGRAWEEEYAPRRTRRVRLDDDDLE